MQAVFTTIYDYFAKRKVLCYSSLVLLFVICSICASQIRFENDINKMIPSDPSVSAMNEVLNKTKTGEQIVFSLSFTDSSLIAPDSLIQAQMLFQQELEKAGGKLISKIEGQINEDKDQQFMQLVQNYLPLFLEEKDYVAVDTLTALPKIEQTLQSQHKLLLSPAGAVAAQWIAHDPVGLFPLAFQKLQTLQFDTSYQIYDGYILNNDHKTLTFFVNLSNPGSETGKNALLFKNVDELIAKWQVEHPGIDISYFGGPAVAADNAVQMRSDTILTLSITIVLLLALTFYVFKRKRAPFLLMLPVLFGAIFGLAVCAQTQGTISVIALGAGAIILGIAIDFSIHFMSHARSHPDMRENVKTLVAPLTLGAITTIGAFYALTFAKAPILHDLGLMSAASLAGASLFTLVYLPHLLKSTGEKANNIKPNVIDKIAAYKPEGNKWLLAFVILATPVLWYFAKDVQFDADLMHLNYLSPKLKKAQEALNRKNDYALSSVYVVAKAADRETALQKLEQSLPEMVVLKQQKKIRNYTNPVTILPSQAEQQRRLDRWNSYWESKNKTELITAIQLAATKVGFSSNAFAEFENRLTEGYSIFDAEATALLQQILPNALSDDGKSSYAIATVKVEPNERNVVLATLNQDSAVTATDRQLVAQKLLALLNDDFNQLLLVSGSLVFLALLIAYGRIELALISFLPMALTWVWILGLMSLLGLKFNVVNIVIATLIFGLGDDYSIFMMDSLMERYRTGKSNITGARSAVYLSVLTTIIGLGTLMFAKHPALQSIAAIAVLGLICVVFVSQVLQPFLFNFFIQSRANKGFMPFTLWSFLKSVFSFAYFFIGCLIVTLLGFLLIGLRPFGKKKSKYVFHWIISKYTGSVMFVMGNLKKVIKVDRSLFDTPRVFIANHASFLDTLLITMLHPRLVLLTNRWVWRSPAFGKIVRMAEYYPVADGAEGSVEPLRSLVERGYSIVVFPEGTRSYDDTIHRFHKGAFYIAEHLQLELVPILMHGVHYTMQKGDFLLKDGSVTLENLHPIKPLDATFGEGYRQHTKQITKHFRSSFQKLKVEKETPKYFKEQIIRSYTYKGPVIEWYCRIKISLEGYYQVFHELLPRAGNMYDLGCGYGFMTYMLHWSSEERIFTGVDYDEEKIAAAQEVYLREKEKKLQLRKQKNVDSEVLSQISASINFECADVNLYILKPCDVIIISDVLHYLLPEQQNALLDKCYQALNAGGRLILRDGVEDLGKRHEGTKRTERWSTGIVNFNRTQNELHFLSKGFVEQWAAKNAMKLQVIDNTKRTSNLIFVLDKA